jgi:hypothetical protein
MTPVLSSTFFVQDPTSSLLPVRYARRLGEQNALPGARFFSFGQEELFLDHDPQSAAT